MLFAARGHMAWGRPFKHETFAYARPCTFIPYERGEIHGGTTTSLRNEELAGVATSRGVVHVVDVGQRDNICSSARHRAPDGQSFQLERVEWVR